MLRRRIGVITLMAILISAIPLQVVPWTAPRTAEAGIDDISWYGGLPDRETFYATLAFKFGLEPQMVPSPFTDYTRPGRIFFDYPGTIYGDVWDKLRGNEKVITQVEVSSAKSGAYIYVIARDTAKNRYEVSFVRLTGAGTIALPADSISAWLSNFEWVRQSQLIKVPNANGDATITRVYYADGSAEDVHVRMSDYPECRAGCNIPIANAHVNFYYPWVMAAAKAGWIVSQPTTELKPRETVSTEEVLLALARSVGLIENPALLAASPVWLQGLDPEDVERPLQEALALRAVMVLLSRGGCISCTYIVNETIKAAANWRITVLQEGGMDADGKWKPFKFRLWDNPYTYNTSEINNFELKEGYGVRLRIARMYYPNTWLDEWLVDVPPLSQEDVDRRTVDFEWSPPNGVPDGLYGVTVVGLTRNGRLSQAGFTGPVTYFVVPGDKVSASVVPTSVEAGSTITVQAETSGRAEQVTAELAVDQDNAVRVVLSPVGNGSEQNSKLWQGTLPIPLELTPGTYQVKVRGYFAPGHWGVASVTREVVVDVAVTGGSAGGTPLQEICQYIVDPVWVRPKSTTVVGCIKDPSAPYQLVSGNVTIPGIGNWTVVEGASDVWYAEIHAPENEGVYDLLYSMRVRDSSGRERTMEGKQALIVAENAGAGYCAPPDGVTASPDYGATSGRTRLIR